MNWEQIKFTFKGQKTGADAPNARAYRFARYLQMGKELGIVPEEMELQYGADDGRTVVLGGRPNK